MQCANGGFLNGVLREQWGFNGEVVSDCGAIDHMNNNFKHAPGMQPGFPTKDSDATMKRAMEGGCDSDCPGGGPPTTYFKGLANAVKSGALAEATLDQSVVRLYTGAIALGLLDDPATSPYAELGGRDLDTPATRQLNLESSIQSMVLLKNEPISSGKPVLPIGAGETVAILGPHFNSTEDLLSDYSPGNWWVRSPLMAATDLLGSKLVGGAQGCGVEGDSTAGFAAAVALAKKADVAVVFVGLTPNNSPTNSGTPPVTGAASGFECEGHDRTDIDLQGQQPALLKAILAELLSSLHVEARHAAAPPPPLAPLLAHTPATCSSAPQRC